MISSSAEARETPVLLGSLEKANLIHWSSHPAPEDGNTPGFGNVVFSSYFNFRTMDKVHKRSDSYN
jgi:hypothetical protein